MSGLAPNSSNYQRVARAVDQATHIVIHPEYEYWFPEWLKIRDAMRGQKEIKRKAETYLKRMKGMDDEDYGLYLERALFYNMSAQTLNGMLGQVFRRNPQIRGLPRATLDTPSPFKNAVMKFAKDGTSHIGLAKTCLGEQLSVGRFGILVDSAAVLQTDVPMSYAIGYQAEDILDWVIEDVNGRFMPTMVLLREFVRDDSLTPANRPPSDTQARPAGRGAQAQIKKRDTPLRPSIQPYLQPRRSFSNYYYRVIYRKLSLEYHPDFPQYDRVYVQSTMEYDPWAEPKTKVVPVIRGVPLTFMPFKFFGAMSNSADVEAPPMNDIVDINLSHYRSYAELEYGRTFTALPVYYAPGGADESATEYHIGPNTIWEVPADASAPGILEYSGQGLKALETAIEMKEQQVAAIGGRLMPGSSRSISESNNQTALRESNEQSLLLNAISTCEEGYGDVIRWWLMFRDVPLKETEGLHYEFDTMFLTTPIGARELRAIQMMWSDGIIDDNIMYEYLKKAEVVPSAMTFEEYQKARSDPNNFLNNPDAQARQRGYADRGQELTSAQTDRELDISDRETAVDEGKLEIAAKVDSTAVTATRKLGDPEQAPPAAADKLAAQKAAVQAKKPPAKRKSP